METEAKNGSHLLPIWPNSKILTSMTQRAVFKQQARVLKELANESRLMIIDRLNKGECSVGELTALGANPRRSCVFRFWDQRAEEGRHCPVIQM